jgi:pilus assembly protein Flp/PilA
VLPCNAWLRHAREDGGSAVEYALLLAGIAAVITAAVFLLGKQVGVLFGNTCTSISSGSSGQMGPISC